MKDECVVCGAYVPEGTMVCSRCRQQVEAEKIREGKYESRLYRSDLSQVTKEHTLLELYRLLVEIEEEYNTTDNILLRIQKLDDLRNVKEEINQLEEELKVN